MTVKATRAALATQLADNTLYSTFAYPQPIPQANSVQIVPDNPYLSPVNQKYDLSVKARFRVELYVSMWDNQGALDQIETMAKTVRSKILDATQNCGDLSDPRVVSLETGDLLSAYFPVEVLTEW